MELHVTPSAYQDLLDADGNEAAKTVGGLSTGYGIRLMLLQHLPLKVVDALPNPVKVAVAPDLPLPFMTRVV